MVLCNFHQTLLGLILFQFLICVTAVRRITQCLSINVRKPVRKKSLRYTYFFIFPCSEESLSFIPCFPQVILATVNSSQCPVLQALCHTAPHRGHLKISGTHLFSALKQIIIPRRRTPRLNKLLSLGDQLPDETNYYPSATNSPIKQIIIPWRPTPR